MERTYPLLAICALILIQASGIAGTWTALVNPAPGSVQLMLLLPDGTVMAANSGVSNSWYKLTPHNGSYVNGTWTTLATMADTRLYYCSYVLRDGRVFVAGGEYGTGGAKSEIYNPLTDVWSSVSVPTSVLDPTQPSPALASGNQKISDAGGVILPDGTVLVAPVGPKVFGGTMIYSPYTNAWTAGPTYVRGGYQNEASWVKLPDDSILTVDPFGTNSERYIPSSNTWIDDKVVPVALYGAIGGEIGPGFLLDDGRAFFLGGTGNTAFYTPSGSTAKGSWTAGPLQPNVTQYPLDNDGNRTPATAFTTQGCPPDAAGAMMVTGRILCALSGQLYNDPRAGTTPAGATNTFWQNAKNPQYPAPTSFFEYDRTTNPPFTSISGPTGAVDNIAAFQTMMLDLPDGSVLYAHQGTDLYIYRPAGSPLASGKPSIASITANSDGTYHLTGTLFNGISQGAAYGDDAQMDTNYPLVRLIDSGGQTTYGRTFNWSRTSVMTGSAVVSTEFTIPDDALNGGPGGPGIFSLAVVVNGFSSDAVDIAGPIWVDFNWGGPQAGSFAAPYKTLHAAVNATALFPSVARTIRIKGPSTSAETFAAPISAAVQIISTGGPSTIGR